MFTESEFQMLRALVSRFEQGAADAYQSRCCDADVAESRVLEKAAQTLSIMMLEAKIAEAVYSIHTKEDAVEEVRQRREHNMELYDTYNSQYDTELNDIEYFNNQVIKGLVERFDLE